MGKEVEYMNFGNVGEALLCLLELHILEFKADW